MRGGLYPYVGTIAPLEPVRSRWPGKKVYLTKYRSADSHEGAQVAELLRARHSTRNFDDRRPITLAELARFLDGAARVQSKWTGQLELGRRTAKLEYAARPYPSGGASYELELYLAVDKCEGLARGFYHYDAAAHALVPIVVVCPPPAICAIAPMYCLVVGVPRLVSLPFHSATSCVTITPLTVSTRSLAWR